ncbi:MAG: integrase core domain-containing protein [Clostridia bacterium]|nr:integrase core domain-containing protein [Clostridia bacterium]
MGLEAQHERILYATLNKNIIEAFHRILQDEYLCRYGFESFINAYKVVSEFIKSYNKVRIHSSIVYIPPNEYYTKVLNNTNIKQIVKL